MKKSTTRSIAAFFIVCLLSVFSLLTVNRPASYALRGEHEQRDIQTQTREVQGNSTTKNDNQSIRNLNTTTVRAPSLIREEDNWNGNTDNQIKQNNTANDDPPFTWSACMIARDETIALPEWLAYHATVLPLERFILGLDPQSKTDPRPILRQFQRELGLNWTVLEYDDYFVEGRRPFYKYNYTHGKNTRGPPMDKEKQYHAHLWRQEKFYERCLEMLMREPGRSWTLFIDADEFLAYSPPQLQHEKEVKAPLIHPNKGLLTQHDTFRNSNDVFPTMAHFLHQNYASILQVQPQYQLPCWGFARLNFAAIRDDKLPIAGATNFPSSMITLQYRFHLEKPLARSVKCIVNVAQMDKTQKVNVVSPHIVLENCTNAPFDQEYIRLKRAFFKVHHYATSLSHSLARGKSFEDFMSRQPEKDKHRLIESYDGTWWWPKLIERVGWDVAQNLTVKMEAWAREEFHRVSNFKQTNVSSSEADMRALLNLSSYNVIRFDTDRFD